MMQQEHTSNISHNWGIRVVWTMTKLFSPRCSCCSVKSVLQTPSSFLRDVGQLDSDDTLRMVIKHLPMMVERYLSIFMT